MIPLYGHRQLRLDLTAALARGTLPASLLLTGPRGVGKQRLALWIGQLLLCTGSDTRPCGVCQNCRFALQLTHPDLHWFFPRPRLKDGDPSRDDVLADYAEAVAERGAAGGLYAAPSGSEGIYVATVRAIVQSAAISPALASRKVFVIGDADRMVPQEGSEFAANAFLKLLEEPPSNTTLILTSSEAGALLPTIRSRVVEMRVPPLPAADVHAFLADPLVVSRLKQEGLRESAGKRKKGIVDRGQPGGDENVRLAGGAPGRLFSLAEWSEARTRAERMLRAATGADLPARYATAFSQSITGGGGARGGFHDALDALSTLLHERLCSAVGSSDDAAAVGTAKAIDAVERAKVMAMGNVNPQLVSASLLREISEVLR